MKKKKYDITIVYVHKYKIRHVWQLIKRDIWKKNCIKFVNKLQQMCFIAVKEILFYRYLSIYK